MALQPTDKNRIIARLKVLTGRYDADELFGQLVDDSADQALNYTHRTEVVEGMIKPIGDLALVAYNRLGTEGEKSRSEGGEKYDFLEEPAGIYDVLKGYRLARVNGHAYESIPNRNEVSSEQKSNQRFGGEYESFVGRCDTN